jgi:hypothetical protein
MLCTPRRIATLGSIAELLSTRPGHPTLPRLGKRSVQLFSTQNALSRKGTPEKAYKELRKSVPHETWQNTPNDVQNIPSTSSEVATHLEDSAKEGRELSMTEKHGDSDFSQLEQMTGDRRDAKSSRGKVSASSRWRDSKSQPQTERKGRRRREDTESGRDTSRSSAIDLKPKAETWQTQKRALEEKFGEQKWAPRKRLSPDTLEGIRTMHTSNPERFTTPVLAEHFKVSSEAIRRILKSKWQPRPEEMEDRRRRWEARGERIWSTLAEIGTRPPKKWREMGVGKAEPGEVPKWKRSPARRAVRPVKNVDIAIQPVIAARRKQSGPEPFSNRML